MSETPTLTNSNTFSTHIFTIKLIVQIIGFIKIMLLHLLLRWEFISTIFSPFQSSILEEETHKVSTEKVATIDDESSVRGGDFEMVLRSLGIHRREKIPARVSILEIFEEREASLDEVREAFDVFDENRDGFIDERELQRVLCALGFEEGMEMENCRRMIVGVDEDGNGKIDFHEFLKFMENSLC